MSLNYKFVTDYYPGPALSRAENKNKVCLDERGIISQTCHQPCIIEQSHGNQQKVVKIGFKLTNRSPDQQGDSLNTFVWIGQNNAFFSVNNLPCSHFCICP